jgi:hypothetical protein
LAYDNRTIKKVIAQELEEIFPSAIYFKTNFIPNISEITSNYSVLENQQVSVKTNKNHNLIVGDKLQINLPNGVVDYVTVEKVNSVTEFVVQTSTNYEKFDEIYVYGKEVDDFRAVDYDALTTLNISATQELWKIILHQKELIEKLSIESLNNKKEQEKLSSEIELIKSYLFQQSAE